MTLFFGYDTRWSARHFSQRTNGLLSARCPVDYGYEGYTRSARLANIDVQYVQGPYTSVRLSYRKAERLSASELSICRTAARMKMRADIRVRVVSEHRLQLRALVRLRLERVVVGAGLEFFGVPMIAAAALAMALSYRVMPLSCTSAGLVISGGGVLRVSPQGSCDGVVPGRAISVTLDDSARVIPEKAEAASHPASELPKEAFSIVPSSASIPAGVDVTITIVVSIPPSTPAGSDIYLSTERSSFNPAEIRMDQVDARHYRLQLPLAEGGRLAFRVTRGSFTTLERDAKGRLPPPHIATGQPGAIFNVTVEAWSDDT